MNCLISQVVRSGQNARRFKHIRLSIEAGSGLTLVKQKLDGYLRTLSAVALRVGRAKEDRVLLMKERFPKGNVPAVLQTAGIFSY